MRRAAALVVLSALIVTACSGGDETSSSPTSPAPAPPTTAVAPSSSVGGTNEDAVGPPPTIGDEEWRIEVEASVRLAEGGGFASGANWTASPDAAGDEGPFGTFGSCSGHRSFLSAYSVSLSAIGTFDVIMVWTADPVTAPGIHDAQVQVDGRDRELVVADGTVTIAEGLQEGEFTAVAADGTLVEGSFVCSGTPPPTPLAVGDSDDGTLDSVEVVALLRKDDSERIAGLATDSSVAVSCPAVAGGGDQRAALSVVGNARLGAITAIEIGVEPPTLRMTVSGEVFDAPDPTVSLADGGVSGSFAATFADGVSVDGAFRCT